MAGMASLDLLVVAMVTIAGTGTIVTATPAAAIKAVLEFCSNNITVPQISICLQNLGIKTDNPDELIKSDDDKCISKCILNELKEIGENGEPDMAAIVTSIIAHVPSEFQTESLASTKSCLQSSADMMKQPGMDKDIALCKFAASFMKCYVEIHEKMCERVRA